MKRLILLILCLIIACIVAEAAVITGGVEYNQEDARRDTFAEFPQLLDFNFIRNYLTDRNHFENLSALQSGIKELKNRKLYYFSDGTYGVMYYDDPLYSWYYSLDGKLVNFTLRSSMAYPCKITKYKPDGSVANTGIKVSKNESYIFKTDGKLIAHWKDNLCFDSDNNVIMTRKSGE